MPDNNRLVSPGSVYIDRIDLVTCIGEVFDLRLLTPRITIYEDIYSSCLTGNIVILDALLLFENLPIVGEETLRLKIHSERYNDSDPFNYIDREFSIIRVRNWRMENDYTKTYVLDFISTEGLRNSQVKVSKAFSNVSNSAVISSLMTDFLNFPTVTYNGNDAARSQYLTGDNIENHLAKIDDNNHVELFVEKTKYIDPYITLPYSSPITAINRLAARSMRKAVGFSKETPISNFFFFENKRGFQFVSLDSLLENKSATAEIQFGQRTAKQSTNPNSAPQINYDAATRLFIPEGFDILKATDNGLYASRLFSHDLLTWSTKELEFDYIQNYFNRVTTTRSVPSELDVVPFPLFYLNDHGQNPRTQYADSRHFMITQDYGVYDPITSLASQKRNNDYLDVENMFQRKMASEAILSSMRLRVELPGNSRHKVGDMITFTWRELPPDGSPERSNKYYSGYYMISAIQHAISLGEYVMNMELMRDSALAIIGKDTTATLVQQDFQHG